MSKERRTVTLDEENNEYLKNHDNASALVNDLIEQFRRGDQNRDTVALELQRKQKKRRLERRRDDVEALEEDIAQLDQLISEFSTPADDELQAAVDAVSDIPNDRLTTDNPGVQTQAQKHGVPPSEIVEAAAEGNS